MKKLVLVIVLAVLFAFVWTLQVSAAGPNPRVTVVSVFDCPTATPEPPPAVPAMPILRATYCKVIQPSGVTGGWGFSYYPKPVGVLLPVRVDDDQWKPVVDGNDQTNYVVGDLDLVPVADCELGEIQLQIIGVDQALALTSFEAWRETLEFGNIQVNAGDVISVTKADKYLYKVTRGEEHGFIDVLPPFEFEKETSAEAATELAGGHAEAYCPPSPDDWVTSTRKTGMAGLGILFLVVLVVVGGAVGVACLCGGLGLSDGAHGGDNTGAYILLGAFFATLVVAVVLFFNCAS